MAASDFITSSRQKLRVGDTAYKRPNSEAVMSKMGGSINYILDRVFYDLDFNFRGTINNRDSFFEGEEGIQYIQNDADITAYWCAMAYIGDSGTNAFNFKIYDNTGAFVGNLFGAGANQFTIGGNNASRVIVGKLDVDDVPSNLNINTGGVTHQEGVLNYTTLLAGWFLVPDVENYADEARHANFKIRLKEQ